MPAHYRHTKIIATVGPATESRERLKQLIVSGVDVIRLNMAHGTGEWVISLIKRIREVSREIGRHVAVMMDVKGPEIRTGIVAEPIELTPGEMFEFYTATPSRGHSRGRCELSGSSGRRGGRRDRAGGQRADSP